MYQLLQLNSAVTITIIQIHSVLKILCSNFIKYQSLLEPLYKGPIVTPPVANDSLYFPPVTGSDWQRTTPASLGWDETAINNLYSYLNSENTKAFIILKNGKIVVEKYFETFTVDSLWYWASAGKTLTAFLAGIAQQEGILNINDIAQNI